MVETKTVRRNNARVALVDDHPLVRRGLSELINGESDLVVVGEASSAEDALQFIQRDPPDLLIVDISLKGMNGIELIKRVKTHNSEIRILVSSMHDESLFAERALRAGAGGYINKEEAPEKVIEAIRQVLGGRIYLSHAMTDRLLQGALSGRDHLEHSSVESLSDRELEVFTLIGKGLTTREIASRLHLSAKTIETHREHIRAKLKVGNSAELMRDAVKWVLENG